MNRTRFNKSLSALRVKLSDSGVSNDDEMYMAIERCVAPTHLRKVVNEARRLGEWLY